MARLGRRATFEERLTICREIEAGEPAEEVVKRSGFGRSTVFGWWQAYRKAGVPALHTKRTPGPPANLSSRQLAQLRDLLVEDASGGSPQGPVLWTRKSVRQYISTAFGVELSPVSVGRVLDRIGLPLVSPLTRIREAEAVGAWPVGTLGTIQSVSPEGTAVHYVWIDPLHAFPAALELGCRGQQRGLLLSSVRDNREVSFRAFVGGSGVDAFIHLCQTVVDRADRPVLVIAESSGVTRSNEVARFFVSAHRKRSLLLLPARTERPGGDWDSEGSEDRLDSADFEEIMASRLRSGERSSTIVAFNEGHELAAADLELALRSASLLHAPAERSRASIR